MGHLNWRSLLRHARNHPKAAVSTLSSRLRAPTCLPHQEHPLSILAHARNEPRHASSSFSASKFNNIHGPLMVRTCATAVDTKQPASEPSPETQINPSQEQGLSSETTAATNSDATVSDVKPKKVKKERLPAEVSIPLFFERMKSVEQVAGVLKKAPWGEDTQKSLQALSATYNTQVVTQILRVRFPVDVALGFFHWLKGQNEFKHNEYTYGVMLNFLGRDGHIKEMQEILAEMKTEGCTVTPVIISGVMHWYARVGDAPNVRRHWERLKRAGQQPSLGIYTAYLDLLIRVKWFTRIPHVYEKMLSEECLPNSRLYTLLIQHLADAGRLRAAVRILEIMQKLQVVPSRVAYEFIVEGYAKAGDVEKVQEFLMEMRERFHRPSKRLMLAVKVLEKAGKLEEAGMLKEEIGQEGYEGENGQVLEEGSSDDVSLSEDGDSILDSLMCEWRGVTSPNVGFDVNAFAQSIQNWNLAVEAELEKADVQWRSALVLEVLRRLRNLETSWPFFHWVKNRAGFKHDKYTCMVMIQRILKSRSPMDRTASLVDELFEGMQKDGINFSVPMFNMMIRHYVLASDIERAQSMFDRIKEFELEPNGASYAPMIQAFARDRRGKKAMDLLKIMQAAGFHPDSTTCSELITCLELADKLPQAYELFSNIPKSGRSPTALEYKAIMAAYSRAGDQRKALSLYEQMRGAGIKPTQDMFDEVSVILRKANRQYDINTTANVRSKLKFFGGRKKALQEDLLLVLDLFMRSMKPRANNAYASAIKSTDNTNSVIESTDDATSEERKDDTPDGVNKLEIVSTVEADALEEKAAAG